MLLAGTFYGAQWLSVPPVEPDPVSVLIADFANETKDPTFDGLLEQALAIAMEGASFITSYERAEAKRLNAHLRPGQSLDEEGALLLSQREGVKVGPAGSISRDGETVPPECPRHRPDSPHRGDDGQCHGVVEIRGVDGCWQPRYGAPRRSR